VKIFFSHFNIKAFFDNFFIYEKFHFFILHEIFHERKKKLITKFLKLFPAVPSMGVTRVGGVKLHKVSNLNIFTRVTANPTNCCGLYIIWYLLKAHNSSLDLQ
jgi:hypothetical protein